MTSTTHDELIKRAKASGVSVSTYTRTLLLTALQPLRHRE
jgi:hypothetical protein